MVPTGVASTAVFQGIYNSTSSVNYTANNNTISGNAINNSQGTFYGLRASTSVITMSGNTISNNGLPNAAGGTSSSLYAIYNGSSPVTETYTNNNINNLYITGTSTSTSNNIYGMYITTAVGAKVFSGNNVNSLSYTSTGAGYATVVGIRDLYCTTADIFNNVVHTLSSTGTTPTVAGLYLGSTSVTTFNVYNNLIGNLSTPASTGHNLFGIFCGSAGTNHNIYNNTVYLNGTSTGSGFSSSALWMSSTTPSVTLRNNIFVNLSTPTGTGITAAIRRTASSLTTYNTASNNNLLYCGTPSATRVIYYDGTNSYGNGTSAFGPASSAGSFQNFVAPRESASFTEAVSSTPGVFFQSLTGPATGTSTTFLHLVNGLTTLAESGGSPIAGITTDYDGDTRNATKPDVGADEFNGLSPSPAITNVTTPTATCTVTAHTINADVTTPAGTITTVTLNYNNGSAGSTSMTLGSGDTYTATIPAGTPGATVTWSITATNSVGVSTIFTGTSYKDDPLFGATTTASASNASICQNQSTVLTASSMVGGPGTATFGTQTTTLAASNGNPYRSGFAAGTILHTQILVTASEITASGLSAGNITSLGFLTAGTTAGTFSSYTINMAHTSVSNLTTTFETPSFTQVFSAPVAPVISGWNTHTFSTPFVWNGTSNILIDICMTVSTATSTTTTVAGTAVGFTSTVQNTSSCVTTTGSTNTTTRPVLALGGIIGTNLTSSLNWVWSPGSIPGNGVTVTPSTTTTYTATGTNGIGCTVTSNPVTVTVTPLVAGPITAPSTQCGEAVPQCFAVYSGALPGDYRWYTTPTGGTAIPGETNSSLQGTNISTTTTFYVAVYQTGWTCETQRTPVVATVTQPDPVVASSNGPVCAGSPLSLTATVTSGANANNYTYVWTANTGSGSGIPVSASGGTGTFGTPASTTVTPTAAGTYTYTVDATDGTQNCNTGATVTVTVNPNPVVNSVTASPNTVCAGGASQLTGFIGSPPGSATTGTSTTTIGGNNGNPYRTSTTANYEVKNQYLITAAELSAMGMLPGSNLNSIGFTVTTISAAGGLCSNFEIRIGHTSTSAITATFITDPMITVFTQAAFTPVASSTNTHTFQTPFIWNGTSNIVIETRMVNGGSVVTTTVSANLPGGNGSVTAASTTAFTATTGTTTTSRPIITFNFGNDYTANYNWSWTPGSLTGSTVTVNPVATTTYTATATNPTTGCFGSSNVTVNVNPIPPAPTGSSSGQCGTAYPTATVSSNSGAPSPIFKWYDAPTGGNLLQTSTSATYTNDVSVTTTFYVSEISAQGCEGPRSPVTVTVESPDPIDATVNSHVICLGASFNISSSYTSNYNTFATFDLTSEDGANSGVSGTVSLTPNGSGSDPYTVTPLAVGSYVYTVTAYDPDKGCTSVDTVHVTVSPLPGTPAVTATPNPVCSGSPVVLTGATGVYAPGTATVGAGATTSTTYPAPFYSLWSNKHEQILIKASELIAAGLTNGPITTISFPTTSGTISPVDFTIKLGHTSASDMSAFITTGLTQVYYAATQAQVANTDNLLTLNTPFNWNGTSNLVLDICFGNSASSATLSSTSPADNTSYVSVIKTHTSAATSSTVACPDITSQVLTYSVRPVIKFGGLVGTNTTSQYNWSWSDGSNTVGTASTVTVNPINTTTYTATATNPATGCSSVSAPITVTTIALPAAPSVSGPATKCGIGPVTLTASGGTGTFSWYNVASGGTALATGASFSPEIDRDTTFYVSFNNGTCTSERTAWFIDYTAAPTLAITPAGSTSFCAGGSVVLDAATGSDPSYTTFSWSPATGLSATNVASVTANPTDTTTYTVFATDGISGGCTNEATITINVSELPVISSVTATPATVCSGQAVQLEAKSNIGSPLSVKIGTGTGGFTGAANPYWNSNSADGSKFQFLYKADALQTLGLTAGPINAITFKITTASIPVGAFFNNFSIGMAHTTATALTTTWQPGIQTVMNPINHTPVTGDNTYNFNTPFIWDGVSNIVIQVCYDNDPNNTCTCTGNTLAVEYTSGQSYASGAYYYETNSSQPNRDMCGSTAAATTQTNLPNVTFIRSFTNSTGLYNWSWSDGSGQVGNTAIANINPVNNGSSPVLINYTATATNPTTGCQNVSAQVPVTVNPVPATPTISGVTTKCGVGPVTLTPSGTEISYKWYDAASGGNLLFTGATYTLTVNRDTTIYVAAVNSYGCEGPRSAGHFIDYSDATPVTITPSSATICAGQSTVLTAGGGSYVNFSWSPSTGLDATNTASVTASPTTTTTYTVLADDGLGVNGCSNVASVTVTVNPNPVISSVTATPPNVCAGANVTLNGIIFGPPGTVALTTGSPSTQSTTGSPYRAGAGTGYQIKQQQLILASELTNLGVPAGTNLTSLGFTTPATATGTFTGWEIRIGNTTATNLTTTFLTTPMTTVFTAASYSPVANSVNTHTFQTPFTWDGTSNLVIETRQTNSVSGTAGVLAYAPAGISAPCLYAGSTTGFAATTGTTTTLRPVMTIGYLTNVTGSYNWSWNPGALTGGSVVVSPTTTTTYTATATNPATNCFSTQNVTVNVLPVGASASASPATPVCAGTAVTLSAGATGGAPFTYAWSSDGGTTTFSTAASPSVSPTVTTTYQVTVTDACNSSTTSTVIVTVNPLPLVTVTPTSATYCYPGGTAVTLTASGADTYVWSPAVGLSSTTGNIVQASPSATTTYTVTGTDAIGCSNTASTIITSSPLIQNPVASATPTALCAGSPISLTSSATLNGAVTGYTMNSNSGVAFIDISSTGTTVGTLGDDTEHNISVPSFNFNGTVYTTARVGTNGLLVFGSTSGEISLSNVALPSTANSAGNVFLAPWWDDLDIQTGANIFTQTVGNKFIVQFNNMAHNAVTTASVTFQIQMDLLTNQVHFVYSDVSFGNATYDAGASATVGIQRSSTAAVQYSLNTASLSTNQSITFTPTYSQLPINYSWTGPNGYSSNVQNPTATASSSGVYTVTFSPASGSGCIGSASTVVVNVTPRPTSVISGSGTYCQGQNTSTNLTVTFTGTAPWNYTISGGASPITGTTSSNPLTVTVSPDANTPAVTTYTVTALSDANCTSIGADLTGSATVTVNPLAANPTATVTHPTCALATGSITMTAPLGAGNSYTLDGTTTITWPTITFTGVAPGNHTITVANSFGCSAPASASVTVNPQPFTPGAPVVSGPTNVCAFVGSGTPVTYTATATGFGNQTFNWILPPNVTLVSGAGTGTITVTFAAGFSAQANKQIRLTVSNQCGTSPQVIYYLLAQYPSTPATITASSTDVCAVLGTSTPITFTIPKAPGAASYIWSAQPGTTTITSVNGPGANDTSVTVTFASGFTTSAITVQAVNSCGVSGTRSLTLTKANPATPGLISGPTNVCAYIAPGPTATYSVAVQPTVATYIWTLPAGATNITYSGATNNQVSFNYPTGYSGGTISVVGTNGCGTSATPRSLAVATLSPATPSVIDVINTVTCADPGPDRVYSYSLSGMPANATSVQWTIPAAGTITSGQGTASITVSYPPTSVVGTVTATAVNNCGSSTVRSVEVKLASCPPEFASNSNPQTKGATLAPVPVDGMEVKVFPNPTVSDFKLQVQTSSREMIHVRVLDMTGREYRLLQMMPGETLSLGAQLKAGSYILEVRQGKTLKTTKVLKF